MSEPNPYLAGLNRLEFSVTNACTSRCRHCSVAGAAVGGHLSPQLAADAVEQLNRLYPLRSVMTFGGEPLLFPETVCAVHRTARAEGIPNRQLITNGCFSRSEEWTLQVASMLVDSGVSQILLSVDAFHQEYIPLSRQRQFACALLERGFEGLKLQPAWLISREADNPYNASTRTCLEQLSDLGIPVNEGNVVSPEGNARRFLAAYFDKEGVDLSLCCGDTPYTTRLDRVESLSIDPNGDVVLCAFSIGNLHRDALAEILSRYRPDADARLAALLREGVSGLLRLAQREGIAVDPAAYHSACELCREIWRSWGREARMEPRPTVLSQSQEGENGILTDDLLTTGLRTCPEAACGQRGV